MAACGTGEELQGWEADLTTVRQRPVEPAFEVAPADPADAARITPVRALSAYNDGPITLDLGSIIGGCGP